MREVEEFVGKSLFEWLRVDSNSYLAPGTNPPDLYFFINKKCIGVEVSRLVQPTTDAGGKSGDSVTQSQFGLRLLNDLNSTLGVSVKDGLTIMVTLNLPVSKPSRFRSQLFQLVSEIIANPIPDLITERLIEGHEVSLHIIPQNRPSGKKIIGFIVNQNTSADILGNASIALLDRITEKSEICEVLPDPVWLALYNDYCLADATTYQQAYISLNVGHCFERIFIVSDDRSIHELRR